MKPSKLNLTLTIKLRDGKTVKMPKKYFEKAIGYINRICRFYPGEYVLTNEKGQVLYHLDSAVLYDIFSI